MILNKKGFGLGTLIVRIILITLFILLLIWLFRNYSPNMKPFYNNVFRENISYMQDAAKSYFTNDKLPTENGESAKLTLKEMEEMKLLIPFVDKDGNSCDTNKSYVEITKEEDFGYILKVNLVCGKESNYIIEILGCHNYCDNCSTNKTAMEYEFTRTVSKKVTTLSCPKGYNKNGNICTKKTGTKTMAAKKNYTNEKIEYADVLYTTGATQTIEVSVLKNISTKTEKKPVDVIINEKPTNCHDEQIPGCTVQCAWKDGKMECNECTHKVCNYVKTYVCPNETITEGSGSSTKCYKIVTTEVVTYSCPEGKDITNNGKTGVNLKCYKTIEGERKPYCANPNFVIKNGKCVSTIPSQFSHYSCLKGYKLDSKNGICTKDIIDTVKATSSTKETKVTETKWSRFKVLEGWTATGRTRTVKVN